MNEVDTRACDLTVAEYVSSVVRDAKIKESRGRYTDLLTEPDKASVSDTKYYFISVAWDAKMQTLVDSLIYHFGSADDIDKTYVWLDMFGEYRDLTNYLELQSKQLIKNCLGYYVVLDPSGLALTRLWVLCEFAWAWEASKPVGFISLDGDLRTLADFSGKLDVQTAACKHEAHVKYTRGEIFRVFGTPDAANIALQGIMMSVLRPRIAELDSSRAVAANSGVLCDKSPFVKSPSPPLASTTPLGAVSISFLQRFFESEVSASRHGNDTPTKTVVSEIVRPQTAGKRCSFVNAGIETSPGRDELWGGPASGAEMFFMSHAWDAPFRAILETALEVFQGRDPARTFVWIVRARSRMRPAPAPHAASDDGTSPPPETTASCFVVRRERTLTLALPFSMQPQDIFAINQHDAMADLRGGRTLSETVDLSTRVVLVLARDARPLTRLWCLYEVRVA